MQHSPTETRLHAAATLQHTLCQLTQRMPVSAHLGWTFTSLDITASMEWYGDDSIVDRNLASSTASECTSCHQQGQAGSKIFLQQNPPVFNWGAG